MKQTRLIVILLVLVMALAITAVVAFAQGTPTPQVPGFGRSMMNGMGGMMGRGQMGSGMMGQGWQGGQMGPGMMNGMGGMMGNFNLLDIVAEQVGITADEVRDELATGISIAELAAKYDVDVQVIVDAALAQHQAALDAAVESGTMTPEQAATMQTMMASMLATRISQPWGAGHGGMNGPCPGMGAQGNVPNA